MALGISRCARNDKQPIVTLADRLKTITSQPLSLVPVSPFQLSI
jgi:hypothetical protein